LLQQHPPVLNWAPYNGRKMVISFQVNLSLPVANDLVGTTGGKLLCGLMTFLAPDQGISHLLDLILKFSIH